VTDISINRGFFPLGKLIQAKHLGGEAVSDVNEADNSDSASATITITWRLAPLSDE